MFASFFRTCDGHSHDKMSCSILLKMSRPRNLWKRKHSTDGWSKFTGHRPCWSHWHKEKRGAGTMAPKGQTKKTPAGRVAVLILSHLPMLLLHPSLSEIENNPFLELKHSPNIDGPYWQHSFHILYTTSTMLVTLTLCLNFFLKFRELLKKKKKTKREPSNAEHAYLALLDHPSLIMHAKFHSTRAVKSDISKKEGLPRGDQLPSSIS